MPGKNTLAYFVPLTEMKKKKFYNISNSQAIMKLPFDKPRLENVTVHITQCDKNAM
jgi:hypothetical protein